MRTYSQITKNAGWGEKDFNMFWLECSFNFLYFAEHVLGFQIADYHKEWYDLVEKYKRICIISFRGSGKTCFFAAYFLWKAAFKHNLEFLIISNSLQQSKDIIKITRDMILNNELLSQLVPKSKEALWSSTELTTTTGCRFSCRPYNPNVRGKHPDYIMCIKGDTLIDTINGAKPIKFITEKDYVKTHTGKYHKVLKTYKRKSYEKKYEIHTKYSKLLLTGEHPVAVLKKQLKWKKAKNLELKDILIFPINGRNRISEDFGELLGYWLAEGSLMKRGIRWTFGSHEKQLIKRTAYLIKKLFNKHITYDTHNSWAVTLVVSSIKLNKLFKQFGRNSYTKKITLACFKSNTITKAKIIYGWLKGDGSWRNGVVGTTVSKNLKEGIKKLSKEIGLSIKEKKIKNRYDLYFSANSKRKLLNLINSKRNRKYALFPITKIVKKRHEGFVYNLKIEKNNSYIANGFIVHNCDEAGEYDDKSIFWNVISPTVDLKLGRIIIIGTPKSPVDLLMELFYENDEYYSKIYPIISQDKPLWSQRYTMEQHDIFNKRSIPQILREKGELPFQQEYMCQPIGSANSLFPYEILTKAKDNSLSFLPFGKQNKDYFLGCDFAISDKARGDYSVFLILERSKDSHLQVVNMLRMKATALQFQIEAIKRLNREFNPKKILIDQTGMGEAFYNELKDELYNLFGFHFTAPEKQRILLNLRHEFEKGNVTIPNSRERNTYELTQILFKELNEMIIKVKGASVKYESAGKHDDTVIALALANEAARSQGYGNISIGFI